VKLKKKKETYGAVIVEVEGNLIGGPESEKFHAFFKELINEGKTNIIVNLKKVPWANSQGIGMLIGAHTSIKNAGGELILTNVVDRIESLLVVTQLLRIFKSYDTEDEAVKHFTDKRESGDETGASAGA